MTTARVALILLATFVAALPAAAAHRPAHRHVMQHEQTAPPHFDGAKFLEDLARNVG